MPLRKPYFLKEDVLYRIVKTDNSEYEVAVLPKSLIGHVLMEAHNNLGHNGIQHTYTLIQHLYYWKGIKNTITNHVKTCKKCQGRNWQIVKYPELHFDVVTFPMEFISLDLIGELHHHPVKATNMPWQLSVCFWVMSFVLLCTTIP